MSYVAMRNVESGALYGWGYGKHGVLGAEAAQDINVKPLRVGGHLSDKKVIRFSCGGMHTVAISDTGGIYSWGEGRDYKLGQPTDKDVFLPLPIKAFDNHVVTKVSCGSNATLLLRGSNSIAIYYRNEGRQLFPILESPTVGDIYSLALNVWACSLSV
jgi:alpha-tubulin suppressor-like RCC1 family protein